MLQTAKQKRWQKAWRKRHPNYHREWMAERRYAQRMNQLAGRNVALGFKLRQPKSVWKQIVREYLGL